MSKPVWVARCPIDGCIWGAQSDSSDPDLQSTLGRWSLDGLHVRREPGPVTLGPTCDHWSLLQGSFVIAKREGES